VQFLRNFRDKLVLSTAAGSAFIQVFNAWYYSFSPSVAQFIANNDPIRAPIRVMLYPLLGVLGLSSFVYSLFSGAPEFGVVMAGLVASSLIGLVYLTLPALAAFSTLAKRRKIRITSIARVSLAMLAIALALLGAGELAGSLLLLAVASSAIVLTCIIAVPTIVAFAILRPNK
jgi:peptide/nickel transport system substrate-binding protein